MRAKDFTKPVQEQEIVEVVPALAAVGRVGAKLGTAAAKAGVKMGAQLGKVGANKAKGIGTKAVQAVQQAQDKVSQAILKKGSKLAIPTQAGKETEFGTSCHGSFLKHKNSSQTQNLIQSIIRNV